MEGIWKVITDTTRTVDQTLLQIALAVIVLFVAYRLFSFFIDRAIKFQGKLLHTSTCRWNTTVLIMVKSIVKYVVGIILVIYTLTLFGIDTTTWLAGLGIVGLLVGLALQDVAKDFLQGFFIITEGQFSVGDTVDIKGIRGEVMQIGLKSTVIRDYKGTFAIFANRDVTQVLNYSADTSLAIVDIALDEDVEIARIDKIFNDLIPVFEKYEYVTGPVRYIGLDRVESEGMVFKITAETAPLKHFEVRRAMIKKIQGTLNKQKIHSKSIEAD